MKKITITLLCLALALSVHGQGYFDFNNLLSPGTITLGNVLPGEGAFGNFAGNGYTASLFWGSSSAFSFSQLTPDPVADTVFFGNAISEPNQNNGAGLFAGGTVFLPTTGQIQVAVAVWFSGPGPSGTAHSLVEAEDDGYNVGFSSLIPITLKLPGDPYPFVPDLSALPSFQVGIIPEPSTFALFGLSAAAALPFFRRRK